MDEIEQRLTDILKEAAKHLKINSYSLNLNVSGSTSDGFLSEVYTVSICDNTTNTKIDLVVKVAPKGGMKRQNGCAESAYNNEINFYKAVIPILKRIQVERNVSNIFDAMPEYVYSTNESTKEAIVLRDITASGFQLRDKNLMFDDEHVKFIFNTYGRFHALSFCLRDQKPEEYLSLTKLCKNVFEELHGRHSFSFMLKKFVEKSFEALDPDSDSAVREKFKKYVDRTSEIFAECIDYKGNFSGLLHGDCWSNNMMFKYKNPRVPSELESMHLIDFQLIRIGTPVYDLSYFFYSGASESLFQKLKYYLDVYYDSFSKFAEELGSDANKILPKEALLDDWKNYSKFGMLMSLVLIKVKLSHKKNSAVQTAEEVYNDRIRALLIHMYEIDAL